MRPKERDVLLFLLAESAGCSDGWSFLGLGHAFVANMTGNTVLLGIAVFQKGRDLLHPAIALGCYLVGVAIASMITRRIAPGQVWPRAISWTLLLEALLLTGAEVAWVMRSHEIQGAASLSLNWMLASVAVAIGLQSGAMVQLNIPGIVTTYITGTWTTLINGLTRLASHNPAIERPSRQAHQFEERLLLQSAILAVYFLSAMLAGWLLRYLPLAVGALPAASVLSVAIYGAIRR